MDKGRLKENTIHGTVEFPLAVYKQEADEEFCVKLHWHEETEIVFLIKGQFLVDINMKKYKINGPALLFIGSGDIHSIHGEGGCLENAVVFDMEMLSFEHFDGVQYQIIKPLLEKKMQFPQMITPADNTWEEISGLYRAILRCAEHEKTAYGMRIKAYLYEILAIFYENEKFINMTGSEGHTIQKIENVKKILRHIHENYKVQIKIPDLAKLVGMNEQYFCRYFKKITGKTPIQYINEIRIEKAAQYLQETDRKIIDIAMECGYDNIGYFIKRFRTEKGISPSEYRKSQNSATISHNG